MAVKLLIKLLQVLGLKTSSKQNEWMTQDLNMKFYVPFKLLDKNTSNLQT